MSGILEESDDQKHVSEKKTTLYQFKVEKSKPIIYVGLPLNLPTSVYMRSVLFQHNSSADIYRNKAGGQVSKTSYI